MCVSRLRTICMCKVSSVIFGLAKGVPVSCRHFSVFGLRLSFWPVQWSYFKEVIEHIKQNWIFHFKLNWIQVQVFKKFLVGRCFRPKIGQRPLDVILTRLREILSDCNPKVYAPCTVSLSCWRSDILPVCVVRSVTLQRSKISMCTEYDIPWRNRPGLVPEAA